MLWFRIHQCLLPKSCRSFRNRSSLFHSSSDKSRLWAKFSCCCQCLYWQTKLLDSTATVLSVEKISPKMFHSMPVHCGHFLTDVYWSRCLEHINATLLFCFFISWAKDQPAMTRENRNVLLVWSQPVVRWQAKECNFILHFDNRISGLVVCVPWITIYEYDYFACMQYVLHLTRSTMVDSL